MLNKRQRKTLVAYALIVALAALMLLFRVGGILPILMLMGVVMGGTHLVSLLAFESDADEPPCDYRD